MLCLQLYLLELAGNHYYVGQSSRPETRLSEHRDGLGGRWTNLHPPLAILKTKTIEVENLREAILYENWMTLHCMERYGWQNVRGGDYLAVENAHIAAQIAHIYDTHSGKIRYFIPGCKYLFGASNHWLIYVLELENNKYYIGSGKRLGKALGRHFSGSGTTFTRDNKPLKVAELIVVKPGSGHYLGIKQELKEKYTLRYGHENVA